MHSENYTVLKQLAEPEMLEKITNCLKEREIDFQVINPYRNKRNFDNDEGFIETDIQIRQCDVLRVSHVISDLEKKKNLNRVRSSRKIQIISCLVLGFLGALLGFLAGAL